MEAVIYIYKSGSMLVLSVLVDPFLKKLISQLKLASAAY